MTWRHTHEHENGPYCRERNSHGVILARKTVHHGKYENGHHSCFWYARNGTKNLDNAHAYCAAGLRTRWHRLRGRGRNQNHERGRGGPRRPEPTSRYPHHSYGEHSPTLAAPPLTIPVPRATNQSRHARNGGRMLMSPLALSLSL